MNAALAFLAGDRTPEVLDALRDGLWRWAAQDGAGDALPLHRYVGLHSPASTRRALRDAALRQAGELIAADSPWQRARRLRARAAAFERQRWDCWRRFAVAPLKASDVDRLLFAARQHGAFPDTARQFHRILL